MESLDRKYEILIFIYRRQTITESLEKDRQKLIRAIANSQISMGQNGNYESRASKFKLRRTKTTKVKSTNGEVSNKTVRVKNLIFIGKRQYSR